MGDALTMDDLAVRPDHHGDLDRLVARNWDNRYARQLGLLTGPAAAWSSQVNSRSGREVVLSDPSAITLFLSRCFCAYTIRNISPNRLSFEQALRQLEQPPET